MSRVNYGFKWLGTDEHVALSLINGVQAIAVDGPIGESLRSCEVRLSGRVIATAAFVPFEETTLVMTGFGCVDERGVDRKDVLREVFKWALTEEWKGLSQTFESFALVCWCFTDWLAAYELARGLTIWPVSHEEGPYGVIAERDRLYEALHVQQGNWKRGWSVQGSLLTLNHPPSHQNPGAADWWSNTAHDQPRMCLGRWR